MDGMKEKFIKRNAHVSELSLVRGEDKTMLMIFLISLAACAIATYALIYTRTVETSAALMLLAAPFLITGLITYVHSGMWKTLIAALAVPTVLFFADMHIMVPFFVAFLLIGCAGIVAVSVALQRIVFFSVISTVEYVNIREKLSLWDRLVIFAFNIPPNIDTRNITMDHNLKRSGIPAREMLGTISFAFMVGIAMWIYLSLNPAFMGNIKLYEAPIFVFSLIMFIPLLVLPWTPFKSLNVRITTNYRDFSVYKGATETLRRMAIPVFAVAVFILVALNTISVIAVLGFIAASVIFNIIVVAVSCVIFYTFFESEFVDDAVTKWKIFRPVKIDMELTDISSETDEMPGTPERDTDLEF
ncbi:MAG: hypothetical protein FWD37_02475 [Methanomassiliicoccaceae archaeon]|nr:hypothetical protein [Methanomassiliicoccaceae archaeon]